MDQNFEKADSGNLPEITMEMVYEFLISNADYFSAEIKNVKLQRSAKDQYGDNAVSYVQLKRKDNKCIVKCRITPEHKIHKKAYNVVTIVDENQQKVLSCDCMDCVAASGGCKHAIAFLFWLHRRHEEPSSTSKECYWKASTLSRVGRQDSYMSLKDIAEKDRSCLGPKNQNIVPTLLTAVGKQDGGIFNLYFESPLNSCDIFYNILKFKECSDSRNADDFLDFLKKSFKDFNLEEIEKATRMQSQCSDWYKMRFGRITASVLYEASKCKTVGGYLLEKIMGATKPLDTDAISRGKRLEPEVIKCVEEMKKIAISNSGIILHKDFPVLGASPDGVSSECVVEVKCPSKIKAIDNYVKNGIINEKYYLQLQLNMLLLNKTVGLFCVASPDFETDKKVSIYEIDLNKDELNEYIDMAMSYWKCNLFPELIKIGS